MAMQKDGALVARAVREALGTLVSPQMYGQLVARALSASGLVEIPESGRAIADWIEGALRREVELAVGSDAAELVASQLAPIVAYASAVPAARPAAPAAPRHAFGSDKPTGVVAAPKRQTREELASTARVRLTPEQMKLLKGDGEERHTSRPQSVESATASGERRRVLAACAGMDAIAALRQQLRGTAEVVQVSDLVGLLDALDEVGLVKPIVLIDCERPTVHVTSIAAIGEDLPRETTIVLWGVTDRAWNELDRDRVPSCRWVRCSQEATTDDVGSLCAMLLIGGT